MRFLLSVFVLCLSSCGLIQDRSSEYVEATTRSEIIIPGDLSDRKIQSQYPIPSINNKRPLSEEYELPKPPNATAAIDDTPFTIDQVEDQIWLRLYLAPGKVWPLLDAFWQEYDIETIEEDISKGYVISDIISGAAKLKQSLSDEYVLDNLYVQAKLGQGIRRNTSEIKLRVLESNPESTQKVWTEKPYNLSLDKAFLNLIGEFITSGAQENRYSMLANTIGGESRIQLLQNEQGQNYLVMALSSQRAWNELEKALEAADIVVADKNVSTQTYYISYLSESEISQWYYSDDLISEKKLERNFSIQLNTMENGSIKVDIKLLNESFDPKLKNDLLDLIFEHIS